MNLIIDRIYSWFYENISDKVHPIYSLKFFANKENIFKSSGNGLVPRCHEEQVPLLKNLLYVIVTDVLIF